MGPHLSSKMSNGPLSLMAVCSLILALFPPLGHTSGLVEATVKSRGRYVNWALTSIRSEYLKMYAPFDRNN